ncbi:MAG TPA: lipopolysaccharide assembly protein LapA domain-containing protein [Gaiellaceae bacterium]|nr:lipopolysaccharide assembly protein LapA domain-containing protein [Gaiellaceae bacterium]
MRFLRRPRVDTDQLEENWQPRLWTRVLLLILLVAYAIAFILENGKHVSVHFVFGTTRVSLVFLVLLCLAIGAAGGILLAQLERRRRRRAR